MFKALKPTLAASIIAATFSFNTFAADVEKIHFLIPGGAGGGWDMTARGTGDVLVKSDIVENVSFQNLSGGGGGKAIAHLIETAQRQEDTLMVNSTPIVVRSLTGIFPQSFRDLTPVAATIADYGAIVASADSKYNTWEDVVKEFETNPRKVKIAGGSARGSMDHLVVAAAFKGEGFDAKKVRYIAYDAGGKAMAGLLSGEIKALSTGFGEAIELARQGEVRILCVTSKERLPAATDTPTCDEAGATGAEFVNWRGFFAAPGISDEDAAAYGKALEAMYDTDDWAAVRDRNGWVDIFNKGDDFVTFLEAQETQIGDLMRELGFL